MTSHTDNVPLCICGKSDCVIPYGLCHCGCGRETTVPDRTYGAWKKGVPQRFLLGHFIRPKPQIESALPFKINDVYCRLILLTQSQYVIVWASDYEWLMQWWWFAKWNKDTRSFYACRQQTLNYENRQQRMIYMHRVILGLGDGDERIGDHENNVTLDCRRDNLRIADKFESARNRRKQISSSTGFKGVSYRTDTGMYIAEITVAGERIRLGERIAAEEAHRLYCEASRKYHGKFSRTE
jgi:AP2 domain